MLRGLLADNNLVGHLKSIHQRIWLRQDWVEFWDELNLIVLSFEDVGLLPNSRDDVIWRTCQREGLVLVTANRNEEGEDSLNLTILSESTPESLPVMTVSDGRRLQSSKDYAEEVAIKLLQNLLDIDSLRGTGRLYVP